MEKEIIMKYKIGNYKRIKIFAKYFVKNNKDKCKLKVNGVIMNLNRVIILKQIYGRLKYDKNKELEVKLIDINKLTNLSHMFYNCKLLTSVSNISNINISEFTDMSEIFYGCISLPYLSSISEWNISNVISMRGMFHKILFFDFFT